MKQNNGNFSGVMMGMAAGAVVGAAGLYFATRDEREKRRMIKTMEHSAENALGGIETAIDNFLR